MTDPSTAWKESGIEAELRKALSHIKNLKPSQSRIAAICKIALQYPKFYKYIVHHIVKFAKSCDPEYRLASLYVIDAVCKAARSKKMEDYVERFGKEAEHVIEAMFSCPKKDWEQINRVVKLWIDNQVLPRDALEKVSQVCQRVTGAHLMNVDKKNQPTKQEAQNRHDANAKNDTIGTDMDKNAYGDHQDGLRQNASASEKELTLTYDYSDSDSDEDEDSRLERLRRARDGEEQRRQLEYSSSEALKNPANPVQAEITPSINDSSQALQNLMGSLGSFGSLFGYNQAATPIQSQFPNQFVNQPPAQVPSAPDLSQILNNRDLFSQLHELLASQNSNLMAPPAQIDSHLPSQNVPQSHPLASNNLSSHFQSHLTPSPAQHLLLQQQYLQPPAAAIPQNTHYQQPSQSQPQHLPPSQHLQQQQHLPHNIPQSHHQPHTLQSHHLSQGIPPQAHHLQQQPHIQAQHHQPHHQPPNQHMQHPMHQPHNDRHHGDPRQQHYEEDRHDRNDRNERNDRGGDPRNNDRNDRFDRQPIPTDQPLRGNLARKVTEEVLRNNFSEFGTILTITPCKGSTKAFIQFKTRQAAEEAKARMDGYNLLGKPLQIGWALNPRMAKENFDRDRGEGDMPPPTITPQLIADLQARNLIISKTGNNWNAPVDNNASGWNNHATGSSYSPLQNASPTGDFPSYPQQHSGMKRSRDNWGGNNTANANKRASYNKR